MKYIDINHIHARLEFPSGTRDAAFKAITDVFSKYGITPEQIRIEAVDSKEFVSADNETRTEYVKVEVAGATWAPKVVAAPKE